MRFIPEQSYYFHFPSFNRSPKQVVNLRLCQVITLRRAQMRAAGTFFVVKSQTTLQNQTRTFYESFYSRKLIFNRLSTIPKYFLLKVFFLFFPFFSFNEKKSRSRDSVGVIRVGEWMYIKWISNRTKLRNGTDVRAHIVSGWNLKTFVNQYFLISLLFLTLSKSRYYYHGNLLPSRRFLSVSLS